MGVSISSNSAALRALQQLSRNASALERNFERLSSGMRINRASDDAAGLAISLGLGKDARVFNQALRNANDGISALNIAGEALDGASGILVRLKELATQAANGSFSRLQRLSIDRESQALTAEFNRMVGSVDFNGLKLLDGRFGRMSIQVGYGANGSIGFDIGSDLSRNQASGYGNFTSYGMANLSAGNPMLYDLNNDGILDIVAGDVGSITVRLGNGDGTFKAKTDNPFSSVSTKFAVADVNGDGKLDLVTGDATNFSIRHGNGDGTFGAVKSFAAGGSVANYIAVGDLNGDGIADIVGASNASNIYRIALGTGGGNFATGFQADAGQGIRNLELADMNGDGRDDIISKNNVTSSASVVLSAGGGSFGQATIYSNVGNGTGLQIADINYDGIKDLITIGANIIHILTGNEQGDLSPHSTLTATGGQQTVTVTDIDGDGIIDVGFAGDAVKVFKGKGDGTFQDLATYSSFSNNGNLVFGDLNGDGAKDVLVRSNLTTDVLIALANPYATTSIERIDLTSKAAALAALTTIDKALNRVSGERGAIGAVQSRINSAINTLAASRENSLAAQGRITDTDVASEAATMTRNRILMQTAASVLAQANQLPSLALVLLAD